MFVGAGGGRASALTKRQAGPYHETVKVAQVHLDATGQTDRVVDAIRATPPDTAQDVREMEQDEGVTRRALDILGSRRSDRYEAALAALRVDTRDWWTDCWHAIQKT